MRGWGLETRLVAQKPRPSFCHLWGSANETFVGQGLRHPLRTTVDLCKLMDSLVWFSLVPRPPGVGSGYETTVWFWNYPPGNDSWKLYASQVERLLQAQKWCKSEKITPKMTFSFWPQQYLEVRVHDDIIFHHVLLLEANGLLNNCQWLLTTIASFVC